MGAAATAQNRCGSAPCAPAAAVSAMALEKILRLTKKAKTPAFTSPAFTNR